MQIVIDIPEQMYLNAKSGTLCGADILVIAIKNGTPLPKGHGKLFDVNDLLDRIGLEDNDENREENVGAIITLEDFDFTTAIIEADKEESEDKLDGDPIDIDKAVEHYEKTLETLKDIDLEVDG